MRLGIISLGGKSSKAILEEGKQFFSKTDDINIKDIEVHTTSKDIEVLCKGKKLDKYDCVYVRGSYKYILLQRSITEALGNDAYMPISPRSFNIGHNKFLTLLELQKAKVPLPTTYLAATVEGAKKILKDVNYPVIIKLPTGTQGKGVLFADSIASAKSILDTLEVFNQPYIIQEYMESNATDVRAIVVGNEVIASMKRRAVEDEARANIHQGGTGEAYELDYDTEQLAIKAAKAIKADVCAVDLLESSKTVVIEVNLSPGLEGISKATNKNVAKDVARYLYEQSKNFKERKKSSDYSKIINDLGINGRKELFTNLDIKAGVIKLPKIVTKITKFNADDEVTLIAQKGKLIIKKHNIGGGG